MKYALIIIVFIVIILGLVTCPQKNEISPDHYRVVRVVDGDTFIVSIDGEDVRVRLIGVDTPESVHPNKEVEHFALEASDYLKHLLTNESVFFGYDQSNAAANHKDRYGRLLAYAYRAGDSLFVNAEIIKQGYGFAYTSYPFEYLESFLELERDARSGKLGLWRDAEDSGAVSDSLVWFNPGSNKYHRQSCRYAKYGAVAIPLSEALSKGYEACKVCDP